MGKVASGIWGREYCFSWKREWLPTPVFFPEELHGQRSLAAIVPEVTKSWTQLKD